jgi:hypothetical protein
LQSSTRNNNNNILFPIWVGFRAGAFTLVWFPRGKKGV